MISQTFWLLMIVGIISSFSLIIALSIQKKFPSRLFNLIIFCLLFELLGQIFYSVTYYYSSPTHLNDMSTNFTGLGYFFSISAIMLVTFVIILTDFRGTNSQITELIFFSWIGGVTTVYNGITFQSILVNGLIQVNYDPLGRLFIIALYVFVIYIWVKRFIKIAKVYRLKGSGKIGSLELFVFIGVALSIVILYLVMVVIVRLQTEFSFISSGLVTIIGISLLMRDNAFLFVTDINLDSIIMIEKSSGVRLYSKIYHTDEELNEVDFIGSVISTINVSLADTIRSHKDLNEITFSNKTIIIYTGDLVSSILIVSASNLMAKSISKYLVKQFEKNYGKSIKEKLSKNDFVSKISDYKDFTSVIEYVQKFIPL